MTHSIDHAIVDVLVEQDGRYLLVEEGKPGRLGLFNLPGGHIDGHETVFTAAIREVEEESGYKIELTGFIGIYQAIYSQLNVAGPVLSGRVIGGQARPSANHPSVVWVTADELHQLADSGKLFTKYPPLAVDHYQDRGPINLEFISSHDYR